MQQDTGDNKNINMVHEEDENKNIGVEIHISENKNISMNRTGSVSIAQVNICQIDWCYFDKNL